MRSFVIQPSGPFALREAAEFGFGQREATRFDGVMRRSIVGIGPFYASLIVIRALGFTDVPVVDEPKAMALMGELYGLPGPATATQASELSEVWRPYRAWATVLIRAAGPRVLAER